MRLAIRGLADGDETVVHAAAWALNHLGTVAGVAALLGVRRHPVQGVRRAVAASIAVAECPEGIEAMIELTEDVDDEVRDWATFALASSRRRRRRACWGVATTVGGSVRRCAAGGD
ncbi:MAG: hypothetical protein IPJ98_26220 [Bryobacterales bacterium]|nr:hypothetical protein [Bryobacterales bacterium]